MGEQLHSESIALGLGITNGITILFVSFMAPLMSFILDHFSQGYGYRLMDFHRAFLILILLPLIASFITIFKIKETFAKFQNNIPEIL